MVMFKKTTVLICVFMLVFCMGAQAMTLNVPKEEYYSEMAFASVDKNIENVDFLCKLMAMGIAGNIDFDEDVTNDNLTDIIQKAFNVKNISADDVISNQQLVKLICGILELEPAEGIDGVKKYLDYGLISGEYLPYYQAFSLEGYIPQNISLLRPNKPVTYTSLLDILYGCKNEILSRNSVKEISGKVKRITYVNTVKTLNIETDDYDVDIPLKSGRQTAYLKDKAISFIPDVRSGEYVNLLVNAANEAVLIESSAEKADRLPNVEGIYKAKIYLCDYVSGKIIFNDLQKYNGDEFVSIDGKYTEFKVSDNALLYEYYRKTNSFAINNSFLDMNTYFLVDTNMLGENEIIYLNIIN